MRDGGGMSDIGLSCKYKFEGYRISRTGLLDVYLDSVSGIEPSDLAAIVSFAENTDPKAVGILVYVPHNSDYDEPKPLSYTILEAEFGRQNPQNCIIESICRFSQNKEIRACQ